MTVTDLPVTGTIPDYLDGRYVRNGPNPITPPDPYHCFKGTGMVHGVRLGDGRAQWYRNRLIRSSDVCQALGEPTRPTDVDVELDFAPNTHVIGHAGRTFADWSRALPASGRRCSFSTTALPPDSRAGTRRLGLLVAPGRARPTSIARLAEHISPPSAAPGVDAERLAADTAGNPSLVVDPLRGGHDGRGSQGTISPKLRGNLVPDAVRDVLSAKLDATSNAASNRCSMLRP